MQGAGEAVGGFLGAQHFRTDGLRAHSAAERNLLHGKLRFEQAATTATLVLEGYIDDFTPGIPKLRYIEQGNNHAILTVRIMIKDKLTARVLGQVMNS